MKKQTIIIIRLSKDKLTRYAMKFDVAPSKVRKGALHMQKHMKVPKGRELEEAVYNRLLKKENLHIGQHYTTQGKLKFNQLYNILIFINIIYFISLFIFSY